MKSLRLVLVVACLVLLAGCSGLSGTGGKGYLTGDGVPAEVAPEERGEPVELSGEDLDGKAFELADLRGKPVVVNVWWSACPPCRVEQPDLNEAAAALGDDVAFLGINIRDASPDQAKAYVRQFDVPYPSVFSPDGQALLPFSIAPRSIPSTFVLDAEGRIAASVIGKVPSTLTLTALAEAVVAEAPPAESESSG